MFNVVNNVAYINGVSGRYNLKESSPFARYGRNAINNLQKYQKKQNIKPIEKPQPIDVRTCSDKEYENYLKQMDTYLKKVKNQELLPLHYQCRYSPAAYAERKSLMGAAYEAMGKKESISTQSATRKLQAYVNEMYKTNAPKVDAVCLDVNKDNKIDIAELAAAIVYADGMSKKDVFSHGNVDGSFSDKGVSATIMSTMKTEYKVSSKIYENIYKSYDLDRASKDFLSSQNNFS